MKTHRLLILLAILLVALLSPLVIRYISHYPVFHSEEAYTHIRMAELIREQGIVRFDPLLNHPYTFNLYDYLLALISFVLPLPLFTLFPLGLGILSTLFFIRIMEHYYTQEQTFYITILLILSPIFLYSFTSLNALGLITFLALAGFLLFLRQQNAPAYSVWALLVFTSWPSFIALCLILLWYFYTYQRKKIQSILHLFGLGFIFWIILILTHPFNFQDQILPFQLWLRYYVTDFGATIGYSFVLFALCLLRFFKYWNRKFLLLLPLFLFSVINLPARFFMSLLITIGAGLYVSHLAERNWRLSLLKPLTLLIIGCLVLFSALSYTNRLIHNPPEPSLQKALVQLSTQNSGRVLTPPEYESFTAYFAKQPLANLTEEDLFRVYHSTQLDLSRKILDLNHVNYLLITPDMRNGTVWTRPDEGLLLLLSFSESFIKRGLVDGIEIWQYRGSS